MQLKTILAGFGPGLITAAVVLGPGTVTTAGKLGAGFGYRLTWLVVAATVFMATYTVMGARCGCAVQTPLLSLVAQSMGDGWQSLPGCQHSWLPRLSSR